MGAFIFVTLLFLFIILFTTTLANKLFLQSKKISDLISFYRNRNRLPDWFTELLSESHTNTILVHRLGARRTIVTANPSNVEHILKTNFYNFPKGKPFTDILGDFLGQGIFNVDGETWLSQRRMASHEFTTRSLREFLMRTLAEEVNGRLIPALEEFSAASRVFDFQELLARFSFNVIFKFTLGSDNMCSLDPSVPISPLARAFDIAAAISARRGATPFFFLWKMKKFLKVGSEQKLREAVTEVHTHVMNLLHERKQKMNDDIGEADGINIITTKDFLSRLICAGYEDDVIRDMVISFLMAGRDTTSSAMTWLFWLLSRNPDFEYKILEETQEKTNGSLDYESLKKLNFLKACLCESMRLFPPVAWDSKHAVSDDLLPDGTVVKAGDRVTYFPYGMGRMVNLWGLDYNEFRPDRWYSEGEGRLSEVSPYKFPIFQAGPRVCLGKEMAFTQMKFVVVSILQRFQIKPVNPNKPIFVPLLTAHMAGGLQILVSKREKT